MSVTAYSDMFASLAQLQDEHSALAKEISGSVLSSENFQRVQNFVRRCIASGMVLEPAADRAAAQSLITFWVGRLDRAVRDFEQSGELTEFEDVLLEAFDQDAFNALVIAPTEAWLQKLSAGDQLLVQRIVLRLLNLRADGSFETIPNTRTLLEGLDPQDRANEILAELIRLGVVRRVRHSLEFEEYSLQPLERLKGWKSLQHWMEERRRFRALATEAVKRGPEQDLGPPKLPARILTALYNQTLRIINSVQLVLAPIQPLSMEAQAESSVTDAEFEEAENYRDKNSDEVKFIYQKRQLDKQRLAAAQEKLVGITLATIALAVLATLAFVQWRSAATQRTQAQNAVKSCSLRFVNQQFNQSAKRLIEDPSGAMLFAAEALSQFDKSQAIIQPRQEAQRLRDSYLLTLAGAELGTPMLTGMAFRDSELKAESQEPTQPRHSPQTLLKKSTAVADTGDACLLLTLRPTAAANEREAGGAPEKRELAIQLGQNSSDGSWKLEPEQVLPIALEYLEADSTVSAYVDGQNNAAIGIASASKKITHLFHLSRDGSEQPLQLVGTFDQLADAKFSPDGKYFGITVTRQEESLNTDDPQDSSQSSEIIVYRTGDWKVAASDSFSGQVGAIAFAPEPSTDTNQEGSAPARVAAVVSLRDEPTLLCYEWELRDGGEEQPLPRKKISLSSSADLKIESAGGAALATYSTGRPNLLFVSDDSRGDTSAWLVQTDEPTVTPLLISAPGTESVPATCAAFSPSGNYLAVGKKDGHLALWALSTDESVEAQTIDLGDYTGHSEQIFGLGFSPDSRFLATGSRDKKTMILDLETRRLASTPLWHSGTVNIARFTPDGRRVTTLTKDIVYTWELPRVGSQPLSIEVETGRATRHRTLSGDGQVFVAGGSLQGKLPGGWTRAWDTSTGEPLFAELELANAITHVAVSDPPRLISAISEYGDQMVFSATGTELWKNPFRQDRPIFAAFGNHQNETRVLVIGRELAAGEAKGATIRVFRFDASKQTFETQPLYEAKFKHTLSKGQFDKRCERFVVYSDEGRAVVGEIASRDKYHELSTEESGQPGTQKKAHSEAITHAEFSPDGSRVVTTGEDDNAIVWIKNRDTWTRHLLDAEADADRSGAIGKHTANINFASFNASGDRVVTASADGRGIVWRLSYDEEWYEPFISITSDSGSKGMTRALFIDDRYILGSWDDGVARIWDTLEVSVSDGSHTWELHGREVASFKPSFAARVFYCRSPAENSFSITSIGRESRNQDAAARKLSADAIPPPTQFKISRWKLELPTVDVSDEAFNNQTACVARMLSARQIADDPLQLEPLPLKDVLREWQDGCRPSNVLKRGRQGFSLLGVSETPGIGD